MSFFGKLNFNDLSDTDQAIYHYMSSNSDKIPYMRVREIANESHTSASSVMRFIRKLGYESFSEFKSYFRVEQPLMDSKELFIPFQGLGPESFSPDLEARLLAIAGKIMTSENVIFFGMGSSGSMCEYAARRLAILGCNSFALTDPTYPLMSKLRNTSDNMLVVLSVTGNTSEIVEIVNGFRRNDDTTIVAITSDINSTLGKMADYVLEYRVDIQRVNQYEDLTSQLPCLFLIEALTNAWSRLVE